MNKNNLTRLGKMLGAKNSLLITQVQLTSEQQQQLDRLKELENRFVSQARIRGLVLQSRTDEQIKAITSVDIIKGANKEWRSMIIALQVAGSGLFLYGMYALCVGYLAKTDVERVTAEYDGEMPMPNGYTSYVQAGYCDAWDDYYASSNCDEITEIKQNILYLFLGGWCLNCSVFSIRILFNFYPGPYQSVDEKAEKVEEVESSSNSRDGSDVSVEKKDQSELMLTLTDFSQMNSESELVLSLDYQKDIAENWSNWGSAFLNVIAWLVATNYVQSLVFASVAYFYVLSENTKNEIYPIFENLCALPYLQNSTLSNAELYAAWSDCNNGVYNTSSLISKPPVSIDNYCNELCVIRTRSWAQLPGETVKVSSICFWIAAAPLAVMAVVFGLFALGRVSKMSHACIDKETASSSIVKSKAVSFIGNFPKAVFENAHSAEYQQKQDDAVVDRLVSINAV